MNFGQAFNRLSRWPSAQEERTYASQFSPAVESFIDKDDKKFHCQVVLPGVDPKDVDIQVQGNTLTISGERTNSREAREADFLQREITYGSFTRSLALPEGVDRERPSAEYRNGKLEITGADSDGFGVSGIFTIESPSPAMGSHDFAASATKELKRGGILDCI